MNLGLKLLDLFRSESFRPFMLYFYTQSISLYPDLVFFWLDLAFSLCFGFLQGTVPMQWARSGATSWIEWVVHGAISCILLARSGAGIELLCQHLRSAVPGRHHSKTSFSSFFVKIWVVLLSVLHCQACVTEFDACGLKFYGLRLVWLGNSKARLGLLIVHSLWCLLVVFAKWFHVSWKD